MNWGSLFSGDSHQPFSWAPPDQAPGGEGRAALLVHGFPGTPAEMRALGRALQTAGWTVQGLLLPGFGAGIDTLLERRAAEWVQAVVQALRSLQSRHRVTLLVGYSLGGAVCLQAAAEAAPTGLALLAPFWHLELRWPQRLLMSALSRFLRHFRPFARANFDDPGLRQSLLRLLPGIDLDDAEVRTALRALAVPVDFLKEVRALGRGARQQAAALALPMLVVQGSADLVVPAARTRELAASLNGTARLVLLEAGHDLVDDSGPAWPAVRGALLDFAGGLVEAEP